MGTEQEPGLTVEHFRQFAEFAPDAMLAHHGGRILWANAAAGRMVGVEPAALLGRSVLDFIPPPDRDRLQADIDRSTRDSVSQTHVSTAVRPDGSRTVAEFRRWPIGGGVMLVVARSLEDERARRSAELRARAFFDATTAALGISKLGVHVEVNAAYARLFGYERPEQLVGVPILDLIDPGEHARIREFVGRRARGEVLPEDYEVLARRRDGSGFQLGVRGSSYLDADGQAVTIVVMRDVSAERAEEERARHREKLEAIGRLAGGVAHDFNNILATILGNAELALLSCPEPLRANLVTIADATQHARDLVRQILTFGRRDRPRPMPLDAAKVVGDALALARAAFPAAVALDAKLGAVTGSVMADATQVQQVVLNLCANARDACIATGRPARIEVSLDELDAPPAVEPLTGRCVRLRVRDDGVGMDESTRARVFEPYVTTRAGEGGHGLGLAVVHGVVTGLGGAVTVESAPGKGSTFDVYLPLVSSPAAQAPSPPRAEPGHEHLLLVDDEPLVRKAMKRLLESLGYRVTDAADGAAALALMRADPASFDLVVSDLSMPNISGLELSKALLAERPGTRIILCSGFSEELDEATAMNLGVKALLAKPVGRDALAAAVRAALAN